MMNSDGRLAADAYIAMVSLDVDECTFLTADHRNYLDTVFYGMRDRYAK